MLCQKIDGKPKLQYFIVDEINDDHEDAGSSSHSQTAQQVQFSSLQDANDVDKETSTFINDSYINQFALYNVNVTQNKKMKNGKYETLIESKIWNE